MSTKKTKGGRVKKNVAKLSRWLHIYLSMISFAIVLFFSFTGLTLNHPTWFGAEKQIEEKHTGKLKVQWVNQPDTNKIAKLEIVEFLRGKYKLKGAVSDFRIEDYEVSITFKGPAYSADVFIDREKGNYEVTEIKKGVIALWNDLHKGRDSGKGWSSLIDVSAIFLIMVSLTGLVLLLFIKKKRVSGIVTAVLGLVLSYLIYLIFVH